MVPAITACGRSFRGAALYYAHDKRRDGEAVRLTTERVAWVETVNLPTGDPERAWRIMAHTALAQGHLKAAAGTKATGRKLKNPVFAYSLAWHPGERPTKAQMMDAARESLKTQGLEEHQAIILCHTDEPQAHVHIIVNRVHPVTGKAAALSNSKLKLVAMGRSLRARARESVLPAARHKQRQTEPRRIRAPSPDAAPGV
jgi:Relaxase/Mobilisation nuclease domain